MTHDLQAVAAKHDEHVALLKRLHRFSDREAADYLDLYPVDDAVDAETFPVEPVERAA